MEDRVEQSRPERTTVSPKHLRSSVWKYFGFYSVEGKVTVCRLCTRLLTVFFNNNKSAAPLVAYHTTEAAEAEGRSDTRKETDKLIQLDRWKNVMLDRL